MWCWSGRRRILTELSLCYNIVYHRNDAQRYEQFLQVGWLYRVLILLGLALYLPSASVSSVLMVLCRYWNYFCLHPSLYLLVSWAWWDWPLTWLTNPHPSVLWHCWLGHVTCKTVFKMTYNVSSGTLNSTILIPACGNTNSLRCSGVPELSVGVQGSHLLWCFTSTLSVPLSGAVIIQMVEQHLTLLSKLLAQRVKVHWAWNNRASALEPF